MQRKLCLVILSLLVLAGAGVNPLAAAPAPPREVASYAMEVTYQPEEKRITGSATIRYTNVTETPIPDLVFHLYLNAFRDEESVFMQETGRVHRGYGFDPAESGYIEVRSLTLEDGTELVQSFDFADDTLMRAALPEAVRPGETLTVEVVFEARLPRVFARTGWADNGDFVMAGQWFPKLGVWEGEAGWNAYVFHANNEFYADFGTYEVEVTLPEDWVMGATGAKVAQRSPAGGMVTHVYRAEHVIDFAWSASPHYREHREALGDVALRILYYPSGERLLSRVRDATVGAFDLYETWYGPYGQGLYPQLTVLLVPADAGGAGGMEYPQLFTVGELEGQMLPGCVRLLEVVTVHELGHQWFQSVVATNEVEDPWLDEGFTDYSTRRAMDTLYRGEVSGCFGWSFTYLDMQRMMYKNTPHTPMAGRAWELRHYTVATYSKPVVALTTLERVVGPEALLTFFRTYYARYAFRHPDTADARAVMEETLGFEAAGWFFEQLVYGAGSLDASVAELAGTEGRVTRSGEVCIPSEVAWQFRGTAPNRADWDCDDPELTFTGSEPLVRIQINPERQIPLDLNLANNGQLSGPDTGVWLGVVVRAFDLFQSLFLTGGGLW